MRLTTTCSTGSSSAASSTSGSVDVSPAPRDATLQLSRKSPSAGHDNCSFGEMAVITSGSVERVEPLGVASADLLACFFADVRPGAQMLGALGPFAVPVRVVAGEHDEVVAKDVDHTRQDRLLRLAGGPD